MNKCFPNTRFELENWNVHEFYFPTISTSEIYFRQFFRNLWACFEAPTEISLWKQHPPRPKIRDGMKSGFPIIPATNELQRKILSLKP